RICRRGERHLVAATGKRAEAQLDELVPAIADEDVGRIHPKMRGDRAACRGRGRARIQAQRFVCSRLDRLEDARRWREGRLGGVELDPAFAVRRLLAGNVRLKALEGLPYEAFRHSRRNVSKASRGLTFCSR